MFTESVIGLIRLMKTLPPGSRMNMGRTGTSSSIAYNRNKLTAAFLANPTFKWILYLDSDTVPKTETLARLLSHNVDVVSGLYFQRSENALGVYSDLPGAVPRSFGDSRLREVESTGAGCLLVRRHVIEALTRAWQFPWEHPIPGGMEDVLFCNRIRELGYKVHLDGGHVVGHVGAFPVEEELAMFFQADEVEYSPQRSKSTFDSNGVLVSAK